MPADPVPHPRTTAVWLTGCLRDAARPRDLNFGDLRHFETFWDKHRPHPGTQLTCKNHQRPRERVFWTNKVKKHGYPPQTWRLFGFQDATTGLSSCCTTFCTGVLFRIIGVIADQPMTCPESWNPKGTCEVQMPGGSPWVRLHVCHLRGSPGCHSHRSPALGLGLYHHLGRPSPVIAWLTNPPSYRISTICSTYLRSHCRSI